MLEIKNLEYEILRDKVVKNFSLNVKKGEVVCLFGPSGCGKTTILRLISKILDPKKGCIKNEFSKTIYLFQENRLLEWKNALENILLVMQNPDEDEVLQLFLKLGLSKKDALKYPDELSGGMRQRVAFARAIITKPDLLLMDEPFTGLDNDMREILISIINDRIYAGMSVVLVTHDRIEAVKMSHKILFLASKGAQIEREIKLDKSLKERDLNYINAIIEENFKGKIYYD
ncbi:MAG: ABC transporter ATP-binding protein [Campylobacter sp.]